MSKPKERFTNTVDFYIKYRPSYPAEVLNVLVENCGLTDKKVIADVGSGTGFLTKLFLNNGNTVYGIEPNKAMREAGEKYLKSYPQFHSVDANAEATSLPDHSVDFVTAGTAFHWFDAEQAKIEFKRILKSPGWVVVIWNVRNVEDSHLVRDYENLIEKYGTDYRKSAAQRFDKTIMEEFFTPFEMKTHAIKHSQAFNWEGFKGRLLSASYSLRPEDKGYEDMISELRAIFDHYQKDGKIEFAYIAKLYYGRLI